MAPRARSLTAGTVPLALLLVIAAAPARAQEEGGAGRAAALSGRIVSGPDGSPVAAARVRLLPTGIALRTDSAGRFRAGGLPPGRALLEVEAGDRRYDSLSVPLGPEVLTQVTIRLPPGSGGAWPLRITAEARRPYLQARGFYGRRDSLDGRFLAADDLAGRPDSVVDRELAGLARFASRGSCSSLGWLYVDGSRLDLSFSPDSARGAFSIRRLFEDRRLLGAEAYRAAGEAPRGYAAPLGCGLLLLWTRPLEDGPSRRSGREPG